MAEKLLLYYKYITTQQGIVGRVELAKRTKIPSSKAAIVPDTPEKIELFRQAIKEITGKSAPDY